MRSTGVIACAAGLAALAAGAVAVPAGGAGPTAPSVIRSIGLPGAGHAEIYPSGLDIDAQGSVYVADTGDDQVQKYDADGIRTWSQGSRGTRAPGNFSNPRDVAFLDGRVYVADTGNRRVQVLDADSGASVEVWSASFGTIMGISAGIDAEGVPIILVAESSQSRIRVFTPGGVERAVIGSGPGSGPGQLNDVRDAATDSTGSIYVADYKNNRIAKFAADGTWLRNISSTGTAPGQMKRPYGVDVDDSDVLYVSDGNDRIDVFTADGDFVRVIAERGAGPGRFEMLRRVAVDSGRDPRVCGADLWAYKIECFDSSGAWIDRVGGTPPAEGSFNEAYGLAVDSDLFVMDTTNQRVQRLSTTGSFELSWGARGWGEGNPGFNWARDLTLSGGQAGTVWVADTKNSRLLEFSRMGVATGRVYGSFGAGASNLNWPFAVSALGDGLVVADTKNNRVLLWRPGDATPSWITGGFSSPKDVTVDGDTVLVADSLNKRVVRLDGASGQVLDVLGAGVLKAVEGIAVDSAGDVWVAETSWNRLVELTSTGTVIQRFGRIGSALGQFNQPAHLEIKQGENDYLFVADVWNDRIQVLDLGPNGG